jgi:hypothetical protein
MKYLLYNIGKKLYQNYCKIVHNFHVLPDYLIIGAARTGTTSLYQYLIQHPCVAPALTKQLHFFDNYFYKGVEWYKVCLPTTFEKYYKTNILKKKFVTGEASVTYIIHPLSPKRVFDIIPKVKIIVMLRNPIDRAYSHYQRELMNNNENLSFEDAINAETERIKDEISNIQEIPDYISKEFPDHAYLSSGFYADQLTRWFKYFPKEQFLIIKNEDFDQNPKLIFNNVLTFLDIPNFELPEYRKLHGIQYEPMKLDTRKKLVDFFQPHNEKLYSLIEKNFQWDD